MSYPDLSGRTALVTGAARGIGAAIAARLAIESMNVVVIDVLDPPVDDNLTYYRADVTEPDEIGAAVTATVERFGGLDVLVNNAGVLSGRRPFEESTKQELLRYLTVNAVGYVLAAQAALPWLKYSPAGRIVNVASRTFFTGAPGQLGYVASKGAVIGMTRVLARSSAPTPSPSTP